MTKFSLRGAGIDVSGIIAQLDSQSWLWDSNVSRKTDCNSPHAEMSDIWVRYCSTLNPPMDQPHVSEMLPGWHALPSIHDLVFDVARRERATQLGGILITRIPPGGCIKPHDDRGSWHSEFYNTKVYAVLRSNARCINECEGEEVNMRTGEVWTFDNLRSHSVVNGGVTERITLIVCMRTE